MATEPPIKRACAFFDGQNVYRTAKTAFGHHFPNYQPLQLAQAVCALKGWTLASVHFYTGVPDVADDPQWNHFWTNKLRGMGKCGIKTYSRPLRYRNQTVRLPDGTEHTFLVGQEKGIDIRIALDVVRMARSRDYDVALIFSQDQDLSEVADEVKQNLHRTGPLDQGRFRLPVQPHDHQPTRHQRN